VAQVAERADARANREHLLSAAAEVFAERGLDAEMKEIAERAGVGIGRIYRNFPSKDDLIAVIIGDAVGGFERALDGALSIEDPVAAMRVFVRGGLGVVERYGGLLSVILDGRCGRLPSSDTATCGRIAELVAAGIRAGPFRADLDPQVGAAMLMSIFTPWSVAALRHTHTPKQIADTYVNLFLHGAAARGSDTGSYRVNMAKRPNITKTTPPKTSSASGPPKGNPANVSSKSSATNGSANQIPVSTFSMTMSFPRPAGGCRRRPPSTTEAVGWDQGMVGETSFMG
jgi:AcrR family transcriptional regulator